MQKDEFYVQDESIEDAEKAFREGEKGVTTGPRDLNQRAKSIVDQAVERLETAETIVVEWVVQPDSEAPKADSETPASAAETVTDDWLAHA